MPVRKIYQIDVDDSKFKDFKAIFDRYQAAVAKLPQDWQKVAIAAGGVAEAHIKASEAVEKQTAAIGRQATALNNARSSSEAIFSNWRGIASSALSVDRAIEKSVLKMAKWAGLAGGVLGGLGAVGVVASLFGIDRLAGSISASRTRALGLGITYGQERAYGVNYSRLVHPGDIMSNIAEAKYDFTSEQYKALLYAHISQADIHNKNPAQLFSELMHNLPGMFAGVPKDQIGTVLQSTPLKNVISLQDLVAYLNATPDERKQIEEQTQRDAKNIDLQDSVQRQWQDFLTQLNRATETIKAKFMDKLATVEPGLEKLSNIFTGFVVKLAGSELVKDSIDKLGQGLQWLGDEIDSNGFRDGLAYFVNWVGEAAKKIWLFVSYFAGTAAAAPTSPDSAKSDISGFEPGDVYDPTTGKVVKGGLGDKGVSLGAGTPTPSTPEQKKIAGQIMEYLVKERGWTPAAAAIAVGNAQQESSFNTGAIGDHGTSFGLFQWHNDRALALKALAEKEHKDWKDLGVQEEFFANEAESRIPEWKAQQNLNDAGSISYRYEGYGDNSTATRVANAHAWLRGYDVTAAPRSVVIRNQSGANAPRTVFSVADPYASAATAQ